MTPEFKGALTDLDNELAKRDPDKDVLYVMWDCLRAEVKTNADRAIVGDRLERLDKAGVFPT